MMNSVKYIKALELLNNSGKTLDEFANDIINRNDIYPY